MPTNNSTQDSDNGLADKPDYDLSGKSRFELSLIASQYEQLFDGLYELVGRIEHLDATYPNKKTIDQNNQIVELVKNKIVRLERFAIAFGLMFLLQTILIVLIFFK